MSGTVVPLRGNAVPQAAEPRENVIEILRDALAKAESGEVQAVVVAMLHADMLGSWAAGGLVDSFALLGASTAAQSFVAEHVRQT